MKKVLFGMMACAALCACSSDDLLSVADQAVNTANGDVAYMTVRIKDVNSGTRATDGGYAYGTTDEQAVNNAHFYLYDKDGKYVAYGSLGAVSGTATEESTTTGNIEWSSNTVVAVYGLYADQPLPTQMLTVLNQPSGINLEHQSLETALKTLAGTPWGNTTDGFVMSTSVYEGTSGAVNTTALAESNFALEPINIDEDYTNGDATPVDVYVERLAAKVGVNCSMTTLYTGTYIYAASETLLGNFAITLPTPQGTNSYAIQLEGFDVDGVARDAYLSKQIDTNWKLGSWTWNAASDYRSYWAESPNYGVAQDYPTSSNGNTAEEEDDASTWLNPYLRYVDLKSPVSIGGTTYCGENTNTVGEDGVITDASSNGLTNVIVKAKFGEYNPNYGTVTGIDLIEYHGEYYTADDFCQKCVDDVVNYDFTVVVAEVLTALKSNEALSSVADYLDEFNDAIIHDHIYVSDAVTDHKVTSSNKPESVSVFDGSMLSLYNLSDGNVDIFFNGAEQWYGESGVADDTNSNQVEPTLCGKYDAADIVYPEKPADLNDYEFYFHIDYSKLSATTRIGAALLNLVVQIGDEYFMPIDNSLYFTTATQDIFSDSKWKGDHEYTLRNYLLRAITVEADGIDTQFGSHYPNYFAGGEMYYHVPIEHLNTSSDGTLVEGEYGVVRNHWYDVTITSLGGLGRGIADEDEVIVPLPEVDYYYLGADINILSWKMVEQTVGW